MKRTMIGSIVMALAMMLVTQTQGADSSESKLIGAWSVKMGNYQDTWIFKADGTVTSSKQPHLNGSWTKEANCILIQWDEMSESGHKTWEAFTLPLRQSKTQGGNWQGQKVIASKIDTQVKNKSLTSRENEVKTPENDARVYYKGDTMRLTKGAFVWNESKHRRIISVPDQFRGKQISVVTIKAREGGGDDAVYIPVPFKVKKAGMVYIITSAPKSDTFTKDGWKVIAEGTHSLAHHEKTYHILAKFLEVGEYTLPITEGFGTRLIKM